MEKYKFRKYNKKFPDMFRKEKAKLKNILSKANIEHIGSTSIPNVGGKGIIDIMVSVPKKEINKIKKQLQREGYILKPKAGDKDRIFFEKDYKYNGKIRRVHLHLTTNNSNVWKNAIQFRDYLIEDKGERKRYETIKMKAVKISKGEGKVYRKYKEKFFKEVLNK